MRSNKHKLGKLLPLCNPFFYFGQNKIQNHYISMKKDVHSADNIIAKDSMDIFKLFIKISLHVSLSSILIGRHEESIN